MAWHYFRGVGHSDGNIQDGTTNRQATACPAAVKADAVPAPVGPPRLPRFDPRTQRLMFATTREGNVIYEFKEGKWKPELTYPNESGRSHYKVGDLILWSAVSRHKLAERFPELRQDPVIFLLLLILGEEPQEYRTGYEITHIEIEDAASGKGHVLLRSLVFVHEDLPPVEFKRHRRDRIVQRSSYEDLCGMFVWGDVFRPTLAWGRLMVAWSTGMVNLVLGAGKKISSRVLSRVLKSRLQSRVKAAIAKSLIRGGLAFAREFTREVLIRLNQTGARAAAAAIQQHPTRSVDVQALGIDQRFIETALRKASISGIGTIINAAFDEIVPRAIREFAYQDELARVTAGVRRKLAVYFTEQLLQQKFNAIQELWQTVANAAEESYDDQGGLDASRFQRRLLNDVGRYGTNALNGMVNQLAGQATDILIDELN